MRSPRPVLVACVALSAALTACPSRSNPPRGARTGSGATTTPSGPGAATATPAASAAPSVTTFPTPPAQGAVPDTTWFVDASLGFGIGYACSPGAAPLACTYRLSVSRDGGAIWKQTGAPIQAAQQVDRSPSLVFLSEQRGWVYGDTLFETNNGGATWTRVSDPRPGTAPCGRLPEPVGQFIAAGRDQWAVAGDCRSGACPGLYTSAGGRGELCRADPQSPLQDARILITSEAVFVLIGRGRDPALVARTLDGGRSWRSRAAPCGVETGATLAARGRSRVWLACYDEPVTGMQSGRIYENPDFGETWFVRSDTGDFSETDQARRRVGSLPGGGHAGELLALPNGELILTRSKFPSIHRSTDGGRNWRMVLNRPDTGTLRLQFLDSRTGWAHAQVGLYRTTDGGRTWKLVAGSATV